MIKYSFELKRNKRKINGKFLNELQLSNTIRFISEKIAIPPQKKSSNFQLYLGKLKYFDAISILFIFNFPWKKLRPLIL